MHGIFKNSRKLCLPIDIQIEMFGTMVKPIVMYGCEAWGFINNGVIESFCLQFYKSIVGLKKKVNQTVFYMAN
jgi:hypothetical protein